jgi:hypothetical protein
MFSWWVGCGPPSYSEQLEAFRTSMAPAVEQYRGLAVSELPSGAQSLVAGRKVLVLEDGAPRYVSDYVDGRDQPPPGFAGISILSVATPCAEAPRGSVEVASAPSAAAVK